MYTFPAIIYRDVSVQNPKPSVADPDPGSGAFLPPGSGMLLSRIPDPTYFYIKAIDK
jgi:hypothetical protein